MYIIRHLLIPLIGHFRFEEPRLPDECTDAPHHLERSTSFLAKLEHCSSHVVT